MLLPGRSFFSLIPNLTMAFQRLFFLAAALLGGAILTTEAFMSPMAKQQALYSIQRTQVAPAAKVSEQPSKCYTKYIPC